MGPAPSDATVSAGDGQPISSGTDNVLLPVMPYGSSIAAGDSDFAAIVLRGGIEYVEQCVGFPQPGALCADREAVEAGLVCAFGAGDACRSCPAGAVCPGGFKAHPLPGFWTESEDSGLVLRCEPPAEERCLGWDEQEDVAVCGEGFRQGSTGCSRCEDRRYPESDGSCQLCPDSPSAWLLLQPILVYGGGVAGACFVLMVGVGIVAHSRGIPLGLAAKRTA